MSTYDSYKLASDPEHGEAPVETGKKPYLVQTADLCGVFREREFATFEEALETYLRWNADRDGGRIVNYVTNLDRCDLGDDGLTEDEREQL